MSWTDDRVELLKKLWAEGLSASQIASRMGGTTRRSVIGKVHRLGLSGRATPTRVTKPKPQKRHTPSVSKIPSMPTAHTAAEPASLTKSKWEKDGAVPTFPELKIPPGERATLLTLSDRTCRWPIGDPGSEDFHFCGRHPKPQLPYCEHHARIAYQPVQDRRRQRRARV